MDQADNILHRRHNDERQSRRIRRVKDRLWDFAHTARNPGRLRAKIYVPQKIKNGAPLVVVLHGSLQTAAEYDDGSGWSTLAKLHGFVLLFPQQRRQNNLLRGFNWFRRGDSRRGLGEPLSIIAMIEQVAAQYQTDPKRVFVTGLSSGGAMTSVLLATYPEIFAGGAVIAGLPYSAASTAQHAFRRMKGEDGVTTARELGAEVRNASSHEGRWPTISVWHGRSDEKVDPINTQQIVDQWCQLHKVDANSSSLQSFSGHTRRSWRNAEGREVIEEYLISDMGHGTPISTSEKTGEHPPAYMLAVDLSSTHHIAGFWGIVPRERPDGAAQGHLEAQGHLDAANG